jgi:hypothetical protein
VVIASQLGHKSLAMLSKHYSDVQAEHLRDAAERASQASGAKDSTS